jgi:hypothetical protein
MRTYLQVAVASIPDVRATLEDMRSTRRKLQVLTALLGLRDAALAALRREARLAEIRDWAKRAILKIRATSKHLRYESQLQK